MTFPAPLYKPASATRLRQAMMSLAFLVLAACGGGGGGGGGNAGGVTIPPPPPPPPPVFESDDVFVGLLAGTPNRLPVLDNDRPGETIVFVSRGKVGSDIAITDTTISYTSPGNYVGEDNFYYVTENSNGEQTRSEVGLRVDQVSRQVNPVSAPQPAALATTSEDDGVYEVEYELYGGIDLITTTTTICEHESELCDGLFNTPIRVDGIPSSLRDEGRKQGHLVHTRLRAGVRYMISFRYFMDREGDITPPLIWSEYPQTVITDTYSVPLYDDLCVYYEDWLWGDFWACHTNQVGSERIVAHVFVPRVTDDYNIYISSQMYEFDPKLVIRCEDLPAFGCGYYVTIAELDDNTSTRQNANIMIGGSAVHGSIETTADSDWFAMNAYATETTIINVYPELDAKGGQLDDFLVELWVNGEFNAFTAPVNGVATIQYVATGNSSLRLGIESLGGEIGGYRIESVGGDVPSNTDTYAGLEVGETVDGQINNGSDAADWFKVYLTADVQYDATVTTSINEIENARIGLRDSLGDAILASKQTAGLSCNPGCDYTHAMSFSLTRSGYYFLTVSAPERGQNGHYELAIAQRQGDAPADDYAGDETTIGRAESMVASRGVLEQPADADWFRFSSEFGGEQRTFFVDGAYVRNGLFEYPTISVVDANGVTVATGEVWTDGVQRVDLTTTGLADYYLTVSANGDATLPYTVHNGGGDPAGSRDSRAFIGVCSEVHQSIRSASDLDWYNIELVAGESYGFEISGEEQGYTAATRPRVSLYTQEGDLVGTATAVDASALLKVRIATSGQYFLEVNNDSGRIGGYRLSATYLSPGECEM